MKATLRCLNRQLEAVAPMYQLTYLVSCLVLKKTYVGGGGIGGWCGEGFMVKA